MQEEDKEDPHNDARAVLMQLLAEVLISPEGEGSCIYKPPFLSYSYLGESPVLLEGSMLKNLLLGVEAGGTRPGGAAGAVGAVEAFEIARRLGLPSGRSLFGGDSA